MRGVTNYDGIGYPFCLKKNGAALHRPLTNNMKCKDNEYFLI